MPAMIQQSYGIVDDQRDLMSQLDEEAALIAAEEEEIADIVLSADVVTQENDVDADAEFPDEETDSDEGDQTTTQTN